MGKHLWMKHLDKEKQQPGCMSGLVHVFDYRHWHSNVRKMIRHRELHDHCDWGPVTEVYQSDDYDEEKLLEEKESQYLISKRARKTKKRSLKARSKGLIVEEGARESTQGKEGLSFKPNLQRTYSIHHLESMDGFGKFYTDWRHPIIFFPTQSSDTFQTEGAVDKEASGEKFDKPDSEEEETDVLEIFKVDKELLIRNLQDGDESVINFSRSALGLNKKARFSKSRSFPLAELSQGRKVKPIKLENKQKEVWSFPRQDKSQTVNQATGSDNEVIMFSGMVKTIGRSGEKFDENGVRKNSHRRSSSLNESLVKYGRLFENSFRTDAKLNSSKSLRLPNEFGRLHSLSNADSYYSDSAFHDLPRNSSVLQNSVEEKVDDVEEEADKADSNNKELVLSSDMRSQDTESNAVQLQVSEGSEHRSSIQELRSSVDSNDLSKSRPPSFQKNKPDLSYVRHLLNLSRIEVDGSEMMWHASDQPLGPQLFAEMETSWPHEQDELTGWPEFNGCWHHQMLFDLVNDVLVEIYDVSLPYYPKALSSNCHVRPFPVGNRIVDDVCASIGKLLNLKLEEKQSLDCIVARDLARDERWMNLQLETECVALDLEDMIFDQLLEEVIFG